MRNAFEVKRGGSEKSENDSIANKAKTTTNVQPNGSHGLPNFTLATTKPAPSTNRQRAIAMDAGSVSLSWQKSNDTNSSTPSIIPTMSGTKKNNNTFFMAKDNRTTRTSRDKPPHPIHKTLYILKHTQYPVEEGVKRKQYKLVGNRFLASRSFYGISLSSNGEDLGDRPRGWGYSEQRDMKEGVLAGKDLQCPFGTSLGNTV